MMRSSGSVSESLRSEAALASNITGLLSLSMHKFIKPSTSHFIIKKRNSCGPMTLTLTTTVLQNCMDTNKPDSDGQAFLTNAVAGGHEEVDPLLGYGWGRETTQVMMGLDI